MTPVRGVLVLGRGHISTIVKMGNLLYSQTLIRQTQVTVKACGSLVYYVLHICLRMVGGDTFSPSYSFEKESRKGGGLRGKGEVCNYL